MKAYMQSSVLPGRSDWLPFVKPPVFVRSAILAGVIGSVLTLINQSGWIFGKDSLQLLPLILAFITPFIVVTLSQVVAERRAYSDMFTKPLPSRPKGFLATTISHGIPLRAVAIGLLLGSVNATLIIVHNLVLTSDSFPIPVALLTQSYSLPILFGILSQTITYKRVAVRVQ